MNLSKIRKERNLTLKDLGEMIGMDPATVQRAETMQGTAKLSTYIKCANALGVTLEDIFCDPRDSLERELIIAFRQLSNDKKAHVLGLLRLAKEDTPEKDG